MTDRDEELLARVRRKVLDVIRAEPLPGHATVRAGAGEWIAIAPGLERKTLHMDADVACALVRLAPGATVPGHGHGVDEECLVLEGSLRIGPSLLLHAGDFHLGRRGVPHPEVVSETGALVYLRAPRELLALA